MKIVFFFLFIWLYQYTLLNLWRIMHMLVLICEK